MSSKVIEYDLCAPSRDYNELYNAIKQYGTWARLTESTWFVKTDDSCEKIRDDLLKAMDSNDRLFVGELTGVAAWHNLICSNDFLQKNL